MIRRITLFWLCITYSLLLPGFCLALNEYTYRVLEKKPQSREHFVQGLEIVDGELYVSSGNYGRSRLSRYHFDSGELDTQQPVHPAIFAEGVTVLKDKVYQLTWRNRMVLVYDKTTLKPQKWFRIAGEGWGLTNNGKHLVYSDGSHQLFFMSPQTQRVVRAITVTAGGQNVSQLNELEWIDGKIWANIWQRDEIVIIDPLSGNVEARVNLANLLPEDEKRPGTDVLNGIAQDPATGDIWVTGKRWPWMYRIELVLEKPENTGQEAHSAIDSR
tara:strand:+ start:25793 stop:26608 length:816 start_codon:yes stop_codon:yes gene_type:complete